MSKKCEILSDLPRDIIIAKQKSKLQSRLLNGITKRVAVSKKLIEGIQRRNILEQRLKKVSTTQLTEALERTSRNIDEWKRQEQAIEHYLNWNYYKNSSNTEDNNVENNSNNN